jgi:2',3'-cyclic-nucleotide 2'-phosphodiesterase (5'-nucleotidase family)
MSTLRAPRFPRRLLVAAAILWAVALADGSALAQQFTLRIVHTNDVHGRLLPFPYTFQGERAPVLVGGTARRITLARRLLKQAPGSSILVDCGDAFTRGPLATTHMGQAEAAAMNAAGYQMGAVGNNEFKARDAADADDAPGAQAALTRFVGASRFPWLCANAADGAGKPAAGAVPYVVRRFGDVRVAFFGITAPRSANYPQTRGWKITEPISRARKIVPQLRKQADLVIALTHIGYEADKALIAEAPGIDAVVGGDSHTFLPNAEQVRGPDGRMVPLAQAGELGVCVGALDLVCRRGPAGGWSVASATGKLYRVTPDLPDDPAVARALQPFLAPFLKPIARLGGCGADKKSLERRSTRIFVAAMRRASGAAMALNPLGFGLHAALPDGPVTRYDIYSAQPYHNTIVTVATTAEALRRLRDFAPDVVTDGAARATGETRIAVMDYAVSELGIKPLRLRKTGIDVRTAVVDYLTQTAPIRGAARRTSH